MENLQKMRETLISQAQEKIKEKFSQKDLHVIKAINIIEELDDMSNKLTEHVIDWYGMHFPELNTLELEGEVALKIILIGDRKNFNEENLTNAINNSKKVRLILDNVKTSMGSELSKEDLKEIQLTAENALSLKNRRNQLTLYLEQAMKEIAPNFTVLCGETLGAKFLSHAGSLEKLASLPASTLQVVGAEKALFRHLREGARPPKFGYLFQHQLIKTLKPWKQGKMARSLAAKLAIAVREDFYGKQKISDKLMDQLQKRHSQLMNAEVGKREKERRMKTRNEERKNEERQEWDKERPEEKFERRSEERPEKRFEKRFEKPLEKRHEGKFSRRPGRRFERRPERGSEKRPERRFEGRSGTGTETYPERRSGERSKNWQDRRPERRPEGRSEGRKEWRPERRPERRPEGRPERMPERMPERRPEQRREGFESRNESERSFNERKFHKKKFSKFNNFKRRGKR